MLEKGKMLEIRGGDEKRCVVDGGFIDWPISVLVLIVGISQPGHPQRSQLIMCPAHYRNCPPPTVQSIQIFLHLQSLHKQEGVDLGLMSDHQII